MVLSTRPVLESGDRLSRQAFERVYAQRPDIKKAELVNGVVYVASPVKIDEHAEPHSIVVHWALGYIDDHPGLRSSDNGTYRPGTGDTELQPDFAMWNPATGNAHVGPDGHLHGAPELVIEIAASSASYDLHDKKDVYRDAGVAEYIVWRTHDRALDWFFLEGDEYVGQKADAGGRLTSRSFPGLRLNVRRLLAGERGRALWQ